MKDLLRVRRALSLAQTWRDPVIPPHSLSQESSELFMRMASGDKAAAMRMYDLHSPQLFGLALAMLPQPVEAEKVVLDTFTLAWNETQRFDCTGGAVAAWLTTITRHRTMDRVRARTEHDRVGIHASAVVAKEIGMEGVSKGGSSDNVRALFKEKLA